MSPADPPDDSDKGKSSGDSGQPNPGDAPARNVPLEPECCHRHTDRMRLRCGRYYDRIRDYIKHEDTLLHQRTAAFLTSQSLFAAAVLWLCKSESGGVLAMLGGRQAESHQPSLLSQPLVFLTVTACVGIVGLCATLAAIRSIKAAVSSIENLQQHWTRYGAAMSPCCQKLPYVTGGGFDHTFMRNPSDERMHLTLPRIFFWLWIGLLAATGLTGLGGLLGHLSWHD